MPLSHGDTSTHGNQDGFRDSRSAGEAPSTIPVAEPQQLQPQPLQPSRSFISKPRTNRNSVAPEPRSFDRQAWRIAQGNSENGSTGGIVNLPLLLRAVQIGGMAADVRPDVWPLLLGCWDPSSGLQERQQKAEGARQLFQQCQTLAQDATAASLHYKEQGASEDWSTTSRRIQTDSVRLHFEAPMLQGGQRDATVARLQRLLEAYALADPPTGYCQGMADLATPFLQLYGEEEEHLAFWCFHALMRQLRSSFQDGLQLVRQQMGQLGEVLGWVDPQLFRHLRQLGCQGCEFAFQMLLLLFCREVGWDCTFILWESLWAYQLSSGACLTVYCAALLLIQNRSRLLACKAMEDVAQLMHRLPRPSAQGVLLITAQAHKYWQARAAKSKSTSEGGGWGSQSPASQPPSCGCAPSASLSLGGAMGGRAPRPPRALHHAASFAEPRQQQPLQMLRRPASR